MLSKVLEINVLLILVLSFKGVLLSFYWKVPGA